MPLSQPWTLARTSDSRRTSSSSPSTLISVPPYFEYRTSSPSETSSGWRWPLSSSLPSPTASTLPFWGFSLAVSGRTMPDAVVSSSSSALTISRSPSGLSFMRMNLRWMPLALDSRECQPQAAFYEGSVNRQGAVGTLPTRVPKRGWGPDLLNPCRRFDDKGLTMHTIGFRSNILFAIAAAFGVVASLGRPWYGPSESPTDARMEDLFKGIGRAFTESDGTTGWAALTTADSAIAGLACATALLLALTLVQPLQVHVQALARWTALATLAVVAVKLIDEPGSNTLSEPRHGVFVALAASAVLVASTMTVAAAPSRKRVPPKTYTPPPAPTYAPDSSYGPPQF